MADDEKSVRMSMRELLGKEEYEVMDAVDADESVELARREDPHVILLDIKMPAMHGLEVLEVVRRDK